MKKTETLLIVGGTGFIGNQLVRDAIDLNYEVTVLSLNGPDESKKIAGVKYFASDITSSQEMEKLLKGMHFNYVVNLGGYINHSKYLDGGQEVMNGYLAGVQNLIKYLDRSSLKSFIQIGSSDEYGNHPAPQGESLREKPLDSYAMGRVAATNLLQMLNRNENFPVTILRLFLVYGPGQDQKRFLPQIINGCIKGKSFPTSEGEQLRDFCYISDITHGILTAMKSPDAYGEIINLASGEPVKIKSLIEKVKKIIGQGEPQYGKVPYRMGESMALYADISKVITIFSWKPRVSLEEGLKRTVNYYIERK